MYRWLLVLLALAVAAMPASAARNANGAMVVHTDNAIVYTNMDYCPHPVPSVCTDLVTNCTKLVEEEEAVIFFLAAFAPSSSPGVTTIQFGVEHNLPSADYFSAYSACGPDPLELPDGGWPFAGGNPEVPGQSGNLVAYSGPVYSQLFPFYWFAAIGSLPNTYVGSRTYPATDEAKFVDDGNPPIEDLCTLFGRVNWGAPGYNDCPVDPPPPTGACCFEDGTCVELRIDICLEQGGGYLGDGSVCDPQPCPQPEACCLDDGSCVMLLADICLYVQHGTPMGIGSDCDPNPCGLPSQACCFADGTCLDLTPEACLEQDGTAMGEGSICEQTECPQPPPTGACCLSGNECVVLTAPECDEQGGIYMGDGQPCDPNPCGIPTEKSSWGRIRAIYR